MEYPMGYPIGYPMEYHIGSRMRAAFGGRPTFVGTILDGYFFSCPSVCIAIMRISCSTYMFICIHVNDADDDAADAASQCDAASMLVWHRDALSAARGVHATSVANADGVSRCRSVVAFQVCSSRLIPASQQLLCASPSSRSTTSRFEAEPLAQRGRG